MNRLWRLLRCIAAIACIAAPLPAFAQSWPAKPIHIVVAVPPGGAADVTLRLAAPKMSEAFGQPIVIENRAGAGGILGSQAVARAKPDGYNLLFATPSSQITVVFLSRNVPFDPARDFTPITAAVEPVTTLIVNPAIKANTLRELIDYARRNPGRLSYGSPGIGSVFNLTGEAFKMAAGVEIVHVPYKGAILAVNDVASGQIEMTFSALSNIRSYLSGGRVRLLAVMESARYPGLPNVPTVGETVPGFEKPASWFGLFGPAGLPESVVAPLHDEMVKALNAPDVRPKLNELGLKVIGNTPEEFAAMIRTGIDQYGRLVKAAGLKPE